jgi:hypothetical protein
MKKLSILSAATMTLALAAGFASSAMASDQTEVLAQATRTVVNLKHDPSFAQAHDMLLIRSDRALRGIENSKFKIGAAADITVVTLSGGAEGATSGNLSGDIIAWTSATGAYGGLTFNGSIVDDKSDWDSEFYGRPVSVSDIVNNRVHNPATAALRSELSSAL